MLTVSQRFPSTSPVDPETDDNTTEQELIKAGAATMGRTTAKTAPDVATSDIEVDLGNGYSTVYREGDTIPEQHQGLPSKAASGLPKGFTTQDDDEQARGDLAPDRVAGVTLT